MTDVEVLQIDTQPAQQSLKSLRDELKKVKDSMVGMDEGSDAFLEAASKAGKLKHQLDEINAATRGASADFGDMLGNIGKVGAGITGSFQTAKAAMEMFGVESEEVTKSIKTMQSMMAMTQGLASIDQGIKSINKLRNAITATTPVAKALKAALTPKAVIALTAAVTALFLIWDKYISKLEPVQKTMDGLKGVFINFGAEIKSVGKLVLDYLIAPFETYFKLLGGIGKTIAAVFSGEFSSIKTIFAETKDAMVQPWKNIASDAVAVGQEFSNGFNQGVAAGADARNAAAEKQRKEELAKYRKEQEAIYDLQRSRAEATIQDENKLNKELIKIETGRLSLYEKGTKEYYDQLKKVNDLKKKNAKESSNAADDEEIKVLYAKIEYQKAADSEYAKSKQSLEDYLSAQQTELASLKEGTAEWYRLAAAIENTKSSIENFGTKSADDILKEQLAAIETAEKAIDLDFAQGKIDEVGYNAAILEQEQAKLDLMQEGTDAWYTQALAVEQYKKKLDESNKENAKLQKGLNATKTIGAAAFGALGNMLSGFADLQDNSTREGFEQQKKLQVGSAVMNTLSGVIAAWNSAMALPAPVSYIVGAIQAAATAVMGGVQIAKIKQQKFDSTSSGSSASVSSGAISSITAPVQYTQDIQGASIESAITDTRVYVAESDITDTQQRVSVAENENTY